MPLYTASFERVNYGLTPPLKQTADVLLNTEIPFDDENLAAFEEALWAAMWKQNPHWTDPSGPEGCPTGWSSVLGGRAVKLVDEAKNLCLAWHITQKGWLKSDGETSTVDPDEAGRFSLAQIAELQARYPGERYSMVMPKKYLEVYDDEHKPRASYTLQVRRDEFVVWGYSEQRQYLSQAMVSSRIGSLVWDRPFKLPENYSYGAKEFERKICWAWRLQRDDTWTFAESPEAAQGAALASAVQQMRSNGWHETDAYLSSKHNVEIVDAKAEQSGTA